MHSDSLATLSLALSTIISGALVVLPIYSGTQSATLIDINGLQVVLVLLVPVVLSALGVPESRGLRVLCGLMLLAFGVLTSIGLYYLPSALLLLVAAYRNAGTASRANSIAEPARRDGLD